MINEISDSRPILKPPQPRPENMPTASATNVMASPSSFKVQTQEQSSPPSFAQLPLTDAEQQLITYHQDVELTSALVAVGSGNNTLASPASALRIASSKIILDNYLNPSSANTLETIKRNWAAKGLCNNDITPQAFETLLHQAVKKSACENVDGKSILVVQEESQAVKQQAKHAELSLLPSHQQRTKEALAKINGYLVALRELSEIQSFVKSYIEPINSNLAGTINIDDIARFPALFDINQYQSQWQVGFSPQNTQTNHFTLNNGRVINHDFIFDTREVKTYLMSIDLDDHEVEAFELPLKGGSRAIFIGPLTKELSDFKKEKVQRLIQAMIAGKLSSMQTECRVGLPKINIIVENRDLQSWEVEHGLGGSLLPIEVFKSISTLTVDEQGTETSHVFSRYASLGYKSPPKDLVMDKPFMAIYANKQNIELVYMVNNPQG